MPADRKHEAGPSKPRKYALPPIVGAGDEADIHGRPKPEREGEEDVEMEDEEEAAPTTGLTLKRKSKSKSKSPGVVYISRLPPGMTPHKVRHLMAKWGDVGRVYAQARDAAVGYNPDHHKKKDKRHKSADYTEAWVEFMDKSIAKTVAQMLNAQVIGGKKGDRWHDDIWTMKYLSGFKWEMLGEQVAYERQVHQSRLRTEIQKAKTEQNAYLKNVELARVLKKREAKAVPESKSEGKAEGKEEKHKRTYKQREAADRAHGLEAKGMESVLGSLF